MPWVGWECICDRGDKHAKHPLPNVIQAIGGTARWLLPFPDDTYPAMEEQAETRHAYRNGEIVELPRGMPDRNETIGALVVLLQS